jgi:hypothetical protein
MRVNTTNELFQRPAVSIPNPALSQARINMATMTMGTVIQMDRRNLCFAGTSLFPHLTQTAAASSVISFPHPEQNVIRLP